MAVPSAVDPPLQGWAKVVSLQDDLLELELSGELSGEDPLAVGRTVHLGLLDQDRGGLGCHAGITGRNGRHRLTLRLLDSLAPFEQREFFRQEVSLPLEYRLPPSQIPQEIREHWRQCRWAAEFASQQPDPDEAVELSSLREELQTQLDKRKAAPPVTVNVSGGGMRLNLKERLHQGMLVELGIYLPTPRKMLEVVGEVVQVTASSDPERFSTALRYRLIDEGDRDRLIGYIAAHQLWQLSRHPPAESVAPTQFRPRLSPLRLAVGVLILTAFVGCQVRSLLVAKERGEKHEIERVFDDAIADVIRQRR